MALIFICSYCREKYDVHDSESTHIKFDYGIKKMPLPFSTAAACYQCIEKQQKAANEVLEKIRQQKINN